MIGYTTMEKNNNVHAPKPVSKDINQIGISAKHILLSEAPTVKFVSAPALNTNLITILRDTSSSILVPKNTIQELLMELPHNTKKIVYKHKWLYYYAR